ncbi:MAG: protein-glutamate O-methyltransferase CheR [Desulfuromonadaceae bacterium]|nr:protein-glutamate O-methyltransferase CheR [Desulfuromonadaceae bacterium]
MNSPVTPLIRPDELRLLKEYITEVFGLVVDKNNEGLFTKRLFSRLEGLGLATFADYYAYLKFAPRRNEEHKRLLSLITNNETYFFREEPQLRVLAEAVLPALKEQKMRCGERKLRIVSAGCSSGEEVYTLAMIAIESGCFLWDWDVEIQGVDIDHQIIERARNGIYAGRAFQTTPDHYLDRYFRKCDEGFKVKEILTRITRFTEGNLLQLEQIVEEQSADIIFCRNVLIYFDDESIKRGVHAFAKVLRPEGHLFLGHSESLSRITSNYIPMRFPGAIIYKKRD